MKMFALAVALMAFGQKAGSADSIGVGVVPPAALPLERWEDAYDLDGDGKRDSIEVEFTGGGHCCYRIGASLSSTGKRVMLPFRMDGGYVGGLDLSKPEQFSIRTPEGGLPEIVMEIETYNGERYKLEPSWVKRYGFRTNRIAICFPGGKPRVRDFIPGLPPCRRVP